MSVPGVRAGEILTVRSLEPGAVICDTERSGELSVHTDQRSLGCYSYLCQANGGLDFLVSV